MVKLTADAAPGVLIAAPVVGVVPIIAPSVGVVPIIAPVVGVVPIIAAVVGVSAIAAVVGVLAIAAVVGVLAAIIAVGAVVGCGATVGVAAVPPHETRVNDKPTSTAKWLRFRFFISSSIGLHQTKSTSKAIHVAFACCMLECCYYISR